MANVTDAGVVVGPVLERWTEMARLIGRDGDASYAQQILSDALMKIISTTQPAHAVRTGSTATRRNA
jgi:hypothetical protein